MNSLNKKTLTRLLNPSFRKSILESMSAKKKALMGIEEYARYVVDSQILQKMSGYDNNRDAGWGFPQLNLICAVKKETTEKRIVDKDKTSYANGKIVFKTVKEEKNIVEKKFFEFRTINHFLKDKDGDSAVEAVKCILILWAKADKEIANFDYEVIDAELVKLDQQAKELAAKEEKINATGRKIKELIESTISSLAGIEYEEACKKANEKAVEVLEKMKASKEVVKYAITFTRNTKETIQAKHLYVDISFKCEEDGEWVVLVCHVDGSRKVTEEETQK